MKNIALVFLVLLVAYASPCAASITGNTAYGTAAGAGITTGTSNTLIGIETDEAITTGTDSTAVGYSALTNATGSPNTAIGYEAGNYVTSGGDNIAIGWEAMQGVSATPLTGDFNVTVGDLSSQNMQGAATLNTMIGHAAGRDTTTGGGNVAAGALALQTNSTGSDSTAVGYVALANATGNPNTAVGYAAGADVTTGSFNTLIGFEAGVAVTTGSDNIILGDDGSAITSGSSNILIGNSLGQLNTSGTNQIDIADTILVPGDTHLAMHSTAPTQDGTSCGNSGFAIAGNDNAMQITQGSTTSTTCKINFATTWANNAPLCTANFAGTTSVLAYITVSASTTILTLTFSATEASQKIIVHCMGYK